MTSVILCILIVVVIIAAVMFCRRTKNCEAPIQKAQTEEATDITPAPIVNEIITCPYCQKVFAVGNCFDRAEIPCDRCGKIIPIAQQPRCVPSEDIRDVLFDAYDRVQGNQP